MFLDLFAVGVFVGVWVGLSVYGKATFVVAASEDSSSVTVHYIDVDQGDSIFIDTPNRDVLIDGGPSSAGSNVLDYLNSLNITRIHLMIATHVHADHIGGLVNVLDSAMNVDEILINNQTYTSSTYTNFMNLAQSHTVTVAQRGQTFLLTETANLSVFNPVQSLEFTSANDNNVVAKLQAGNTYFLFTGDAEAGAEQSMLDGELDFQSDVLKVGHHGSRYSTTQPFLDQVTTVICNRKCRTRQHLRSSTRRNNTKTTCKRSNNIWNLYFRNNNSLNRWSLSVPRRPATYT